MDKENGQKFVGSLIESSRLAEEASQKLKDCMTLLDRDNPIEAEVYDQLAEDLRTLNAVAFELKESVGE